MDLDRDGYADVLSGSYAGEIFVFAGQPGGSFAPPQRLNDAKRRVIRVDYASTVSTADWDGDGDLDLLIGSSSGHVYLIPNEGGKSGYAFGEPVALFAEGQPIVVPGRNSCPAAADWDGDGKLDLVVGAGDGSVLWYRNVGTRKEPKLAAPKILVPAPKEDEARGTFAQICVTDFNEDGRLDLLVGDCGKPFDKELSEEERKWRDEARLQREQLLKRWSEVFGRYRQALQGQEPEGAEQRKRRQAELDALRNELQQINFMRENFTHQEQTLEPGKQRHGHVWLFLRK